MKRKIIIVFSLLLISTLASTASANDLMDENYPISQISDDKNFMELSNSIDLVPVWNLSNVEQPIFALEIINLIILSFHHMTLMTI